MVVRGRIILPWYTCYNLLDRLYAARSGTVRLPLQSASYCNTPPPVYPPPSLFLSFSHSPFLRLLFRRRLLGLLPASFASSFYAPSTSSSPLSPFSPPSLSSSSWRSNLQDLDGAVPPVLCSALGAVARRCQSENYLSPLFRECCRVK